MIREANVKDIPSIVDLWEELMNFHIQKSSLYEIKPDARQIYAYYLKEVIKSHKSIVIIYEIKNRIIGYLMAEESLLPPVYKEGKVGTIVEICVTENYDSFQEIWKEFRKSNDEICSMYDHAS